MGLRGSKGTMFLFAVMPACSSAFCAALPVELAIDEREQEAGGCRCRRRRSGSRAPQTLRPAPARWRRCCCAVGLELGRRASPKATALAAITCISGPPCPPGKTGAVDLLGAVLRRTGSCRRAGPRSVLCVVVRDDLRLAHRARVHAGRHEPGDVGDVGEQHRAHLVGDLAEGLEVDRCASTPSPRTGSASAGARRASLRTSS